MRVLVVDDELQARKRLVRLLETELAHDTIVVVGACASAVEALALVATAKPDVLLLDISMPGLTGLDVHARLAAASTGEVPAVIFVTAHAEHAVDAFELGAVDYVLKPVTAERLAKAIARVAERRARPLQRIAIETRAGTVLVDPTSIVYAAFDGALVTLHAASESWVTTLTLKDLLERLGPDFTRSDRDTCSTCARSRASSRTTRVARPRSRAPASGSPSRARCGASSRSASTCDVRVNDARSGDARDDAPIVAPTDTRDDAPTDVPTDAPTDARDDAPTDARGDAPGDARDDARDDPPTIRRSLRRPIRRPVRRPVRRDALDVSCDPAAVSDRHSPALSS